MVKTMKTTGAALVCLVALTLMTPLANAALLSVGGTAPVTNLTPAGPVVATASGTITVPTFTAIYKEQVYADPTNGLTPACASSGKCLDFAFIFTNLSTSADVIERFSMGSFGPSTLMTFVGADPFLGAHLPINASRSTTGSIVAFNYTPFGDQLEPGTSTPWLIVQTDATSFTSGYVSAQDLTAGSGLALAPRAVPEPSSLALLGGGLTFLGGLLRRKLR